MCGIAGIISLDGRPVDPPAIKRMADTMAHRGPDDAGYALFRAARDPISDGGYWCAFTDPAFARFNEHLPPFGGPYYRDELGHDSFTVAMGHRRLSIIDLTYRGHQPMSSPDRRYWIVHNGELYNLPGVRKALKGRGHVLRSRTDTEAILHLWEEEGSGCLPSLDGMFAFAIYDRVENVLTLVRDRFGVKPLYYACSAGHFVFASEIKAILASGVIEPALHPASLVEYCTFQNLYRRETLFKGINLLQPGEMLQVRPVASEAPKVRSYTPEIPSSELALGDEEEVAERVADQFARSVKRQLLSDVEVGSYLSGGMDSGSIVSVAGRSIPRLLTFTAGFDLTNVDGIEQGFDERPIADRLAHILQTEHYHVVLHAGDMPAAMERISWHMDDPRVGMCHQNWYAAKLAGRFVKVCLTGGGGDELFAGYPWRYLYGLGAENTGEFDERYLAYWHRLLGPEELPGLFSAEVREHVPEARESFRAVMDLAPEPQDGLSDFENHVHRAMFFEYRTFLHGLLVTEDRISMAHGLEARVPFLDNGLTDLAWRIRPAYKVDERLLRGKEPGQHVESTAGKKVLRRAMEAYLPKAYTQQKKQGFSPPDENWYRGPSMEYIKTLLLDRRTRERPWFDQAFVADRLDEHFQGRRNHRLLIWSLLSLEWLQRHFVDA